MPSESFRPEFHQIDEFIIDSAFFNSDNNASHSLGQTNLRKIRPSFRDEPFGLFRRINLIAVHSKKSVLCMKTAYIGCHVADFHFEVANCIALG